MEQRFLLCLLCLCFSTSLFGSIFPVTSPHSTGAGSIRAAILLANANPGKDTLHFALAPPYEIVADSTSLSPTAITSPLLIDGLSQIGSSGSNPLVTFRAIHPSSRFQVRTGNIELRGIRALDYQYYLLRWDAFDINADIHDIYIHDNHFTNTNVVYFECKNSHHSGFRFTDNTLSESCKLLEIKITGINSTASLDSVIATHNTFQVYSFGGASIGTITAQDDAHIAKIWVEDNTLTGIGSAAASLLSLEAYGGLGTPAAITDITVQNNQVHNLGGPGGGLFLTTGIGGDARIAHALITQNSFHNFYQGIFLKPSITPSMTNATCTYQDITIRDNQLHDATNGAIIVLAHSRNGSIYFDSLLIEQNEILGSQKNGISIESWKAPQETGHVHLSGLRIRQNDIAGCAWTGIQATDNYHFPGSLFSSYDDVEVTENAIHDNTMQGFLIHGLATPAPGLGCRLRKPTLSHVSPQAPYIVHGQMFSDPGTPYRIEYFSNSTPQAAGVEEGETFLGADTITIPPSGTGTIAWNSGLTMPHFVTATATNLWTGNTGCFSNSVDTLTVGMVPAQAAGIVLYPNPLRGSKLHVRHTEQPIAVSVSDGLGRPVLFKNWDATPTESLLELPTMAPGVYWVSLQYPTGPAVLRLIVVGD